MFPDVVESRVKSMRGYFQIFTKDAFLRNALATVLQMAWHTGSETKLYGCGLEPHQLLAL